MSRPYALLLLGVIHLTLIWNGDILTEYAVAGFIALPFLFLRLRWLFTASPLFAALYFFLPYHPLPIGLPGQAALQVHIAAADAVYKHGSFTRILAFEWRELPLLLPLHLYVLPRTIALFLFGAVCWRSGVVKQLHAHTRLLGLTALITLLQGVGFTVLTSHLAPPALFGKASPDANLIGELALTLAYASILLFVTTKSWGILWLNWAAPLGRMAFTNYLLQSVIFSFFFFGWGSAGSACAPALRFCWASACTSCRFSLTRHSCEASASSLSNGSGER